VRKGKEITQVNLLLRDRGEKNITNGRGKWLMIKLSIGLLRSVNPNLINAQDVERIKDLLWLISKIIITQRILMTMSGCVTNVITKWILVADSRVVRGDILSRERI